jgi:hypothetical protein
MRKILRNGRQNWSWKPGYRDERWAFDASFSKILAFSGSFTVDRDRWSREETGEESLKSPEVGYDLLAKMPRTVNFCLLESLGEASSLDQAMLD